MGRAGYQAIDQSIELTETPEPLVLLDQHLGVEGRYPALEHLFWPKRTPRIIASHSSASGTNASNN